MNNKSFSMIVLSSFSLLLAACGGGSSSTTANPTTETDTPISRPQPTAVNTENWQSARLIQAENPMTSKVEVIGTELVINIESADISKGAHLQIYLNTDNKPETGFQFENEAWEESGVDYLIEDGDLFKSTANNTGWNWNVNIGAIDYTINKDNANAKIDLSLLGEICNNLKIGVMTRDKFWNISTFSPASSQMQTFNVSYCNTEIPDTVIPEITLLGANPLNLNINDTFIDPGATATDNIDGDITNRIETKSTVDTTTAGIYEVTYLVTDLTGNSANISRVVNISEIPTPEGIVVDGNSNDWSDIPTFSSSADAIMKVSDDEEKLYILVTSSNLGENTQILMDTDNNATTGLELSAQVNTWLGGADYMLENNSLDKSKSNTGWSWDYGIAPIEYIKTADTLEIAIKKSDFNALANNIPMGYVSRTAEWNANYTLPVASLPVYTLKFPVTVNPVIANNDSVTTPNDQSIDIDVLANDSSLTNGALTITILNQPSIGSASIIQNKVNYTPDALFTGSDTFTYQITDINGNTDTANIKVIITAPINNAPVANDDIATTQENTPITIRVLDNDTDADGDSLSITSVASNGLSSTETSNGLILFTPENGFTGTLVIVYTISDGNGGSATANVTITITTAPNVSPVANNDSVTTNGIRIKQISVLVNDTDEDGDNLQIIDFTQPNYGSLTFTTTTATFNYTPGTTFSGVDTFTYTISDGNEGTDIGTVTVTVPENNAPDAVEDVADVFFNQTKTINVLSNDTDPDGDVLSVQSIVQPPVGVATLNPNGTIFFDPQNNVGSISISYTVSDGRGGTDIAVLTIASTDPDDGNDAYPDITNESITTPKNTAIFIDVLANDSDADGDVLVLDQVDQGANGTTEKVTQNGVLGVLYTPNPGFTGTDIFYYGVHDGFGHNGAGFVEMTVTQ